MASTKLRTLLDIIFVEVLIWFGGATELYVIWFGVCRRYAPAETAPTSMGSEYRVPSG